jgi:hypothetical protein
MDSNINIRLKTMLGSLIPTIKRASQEWKTFGKSTTDAQKRMSQLYPSIRKTNMSLTNLTKDANRASKGFSMMSGSLLTVKRALGGLSFYMLYRGISNAVESAMDMIETANLFSVALGGLAVETNNTVRGMSELTGLDLTNMQTAIGTFASLSRSMGMTDKQAQNLSTTSYRLALDLASLYNVDISQALGDLRSGLVGQSETVYKYGIDVTEASLKTEALAQGITKSVRNMSQGEKMALRYAVMIRQTSLAQGDFARTIEQPANQLRILSERFVTLGRSIGTIFIPVLQTILPYLNAVLQVLINIANTIASLFGYSEDMAKVMNTNFGGGGATEELEEGLDGASNSAKKLKGQLMGFDEINLWKEPESGAGGGTGAMAGGVDMSFMENLSYDSMFGNISSKSSQIADSIKKSLDKIWDGLYRVRYALKDLWDEGLSVFGNFAIGVLVDFYNNFLVPVGKWVIGEGLPKFINIINDLLKGVNWTLLRDSLNRLFLALEPFAIIVMEGAIQFLEKFLVPLSKWALETAIPKVLELVTDGIKFLTEVMKGNIELRGDLLDNFLIPLATFLQETFVIAWNKVSEAIKWLNENIIKPFMDILMMLWETILVPLSKIVIDVFGLAFKNAGWLIEQLWTKVIKPFGEFLLKTFSKTLETIADLLFYFQPAIDVVVGAFMWLWDEVLFKFITWLNAEFMNTFNAVFDGIKLGIEALETVFGGLLDFISGVFTGNWEKAFYGIGNIIIGVMNLAMGSIETLINWAIGKLNSIIELANEVLEYMKSDFRFSYIADIKLPKIKPLEYKESVKTKPQLMANGGIPDYGQVFIAREAGAELVGGFGSKTAVMNNDQIVDAVANGVAQAVAGVMQIGNAGQQSGQPVVLHLDGKELGRMILPKLNSEATRMGYKPILTNR